MRPFCLAGRLCCAYPLACVLVLSSIVGGPPQARANEPLDLHRALSSALEQHPRLHIFELRQERLGGLRQRADLAPALQLEAELEAFGGSGEFQGFERSEQTLALSSVIEMGRKRAARVALVDARTGLLDTEHQAAGLALAADVTRAFVEAIAARERLQLAQQAAALASDAVELVSRRSKAGAAPRAEVLRAEAALVQANLTVTGARRELATRKLRLAALMGRPGADIGTLSGNLFDLPAIGDFDQLYRQAQTNPVLQALHREERLKQAEVDLARSGTAADLRWRLGLRRLESTGDTGLVASVSLPLFTASRNRGEVRAARAERDQVILERKETELRLYALLHGAHTQLQQSLETVRLLEGDVVPALREALFITRDAYDSGRYSYMEWMAAQQELLDARLRLITAAASALNQAATIEQFTAEPVFATFATPAEEG